MSQPFTRNFALGLAIAVLCPAHDSIAQTVQSAACLSSPSSANCSEPLVLQSTQQQIKPAFPDPQPACQNVTNSCSFDLAVPVASQQEWSSFLQSQFLHTPGTCASVSDCAAACQGGNWGVTQFVDRSGYTVILQNCYWNLPDSQAGQTQNMGGAVPSAGCMGYYPSDPGIGWFNYTGTISLISATCTPTGYVGVIQSKSPNCEAGGRVRRCEGYDIFDETWNLTKE